MDLNKAFNNLVVLRSLDANGRCVGQQRARNTMTFAFATATINAFLRSGPYQVTYLYARFGDSGANPGTLNPAQGDMRNANRNNFLASADNVRGGLWVPLQAPPQQNTSDSSTYLGNQATYSFWIPGSSAISPAQVSPAANYTSASYIYALGLAISPNINDRSQDIIIGALQGFTPQPIPSGGQASVSYPLQMTIN